MYHVYYAIITIMQISSNFEHGFTTFKMTFGFKVMRIFLFIILSPLHFVFAGYSKKSFKGQNRYS